MKPAIAEKSGNTPSSWVCVCPRGLREVQCRHIEQGRESGHTGGDGALSSSDCPRLGSLCQVRVRLKEGPEMGQLDASLSVTPDQPITELTGTQPIPFPRALDSVLQVPLGDWTVLRLGDGQCDITESCLEGMTARGMCEILLTPVRHGSKASADLVLCPGTDDAEGENATDQPLSAIVELHSFTPGRESWEVPPGEKWSWLRSHKERGGARFRSGDVWGAADSYSRALKLLITLQQHTRDTSGGMEDIEEKEEEEEEDQQTGDATQQPPSEAPLPTLREYRSVKAELHSNLSLCQLKLHLPERARTNAAKAVQLEPDGAKAWYRLGQACLEVADLGEARRAFQRLLELQPDSSTAQKGLREVGNRERETNSQLGQRLSKMFS
ncbi:FK506-binding protein-like [Osmerus mordax]|uniref:FK506-binding protein-like n=1 Tax=Osmerus mordax TaxID=8014 RepID=UPI00350FCD68